jgi:hypothetical protein
VGNSLKTVVAFSVVLALAFGLSQPLAASHNGEAAATSISSNSHHQDDASSTNIEHSTHCATACIQIDKPSQILKVKKNKRDHKDELQHFWKHINAQIKPIEPAQKRNYKPDKLYDNNLYLRHSLLRL